MSSSLTDPLLQQQYEADSLESPPLVIDAVRVDECPSPPTSAGSFHNNNGSSCAQRSRLNRSDERQDEEDERRPNRTHNIPRGMWRDGLCDCFDNCGVCIASWCFGTIALGQIMTRMQLGLDGRPSNHPQKGRSCRVLLWATVVSGMLGLFHHSNIISTIFGFYVVFLLFRVTRHVQKRYELPGDTCGTLFQTLCCSCCLTARLVRHTADHAKYPYHLCDERGLSRQAPGHPLTTEDEVEQVDWEVLSVHDGDAV